ncbi:hypothetical protein GCM10007939_21990 [Amylibacter marinus]|uniref:Uncharacterized protein n=1 Tax=Amylibacter marinus TaxID=1475483 RepID=A0ABQ5VWW6_9RHOB|nr:hypothetical protein [Amylibacter marinus]GLQ35915.1 hypothetical protein GCM10007939_21990 [Amylibacter marinus]
MSFIRPELRDSFMKWRELIVILPLLILALYLVWNAIALGGRVLVVIYALVAVISLFGTYWAYRRGHMRVLGAAFGHVEIDERQIIYFLNGEGWPVSINDLVDVQIARTDQNGAPDKVFWQFKDRAGTRVVIPASATGADRLVDALSALNGVDYPMVIQAMNSEVDAVFTIWRNSE